MAGEPENEGPSISVSMREEMAGGVWANLVGVSHSPYEFTLDFIRLDFTTGSPMEGVVVQRVNMSPLLVMQLITTLQRNWDDYAAKAMPPEVTQHDNDDDNN